MAWALLWPLGPLQVIVDLLQLPDVFLKLVFDGRVLGELALQAGDLPVRLRVLRLILLLRGQRKQSRAGTECFHELDIQGLERGLNPTFTLFPVGASPLKHSPLYNCLMEGAIPSRHKPNWSPQLLFLPWMGPLWPPVSPQRWRTPVSLSKAAPPISWWLCEHLLRAFSVSTKAAAPSALKVWSLAFLQYEHLSVGIQVFWVQLGCWPLHYLVVLQLHLEAIVGRQQLTIPHFTLFELRLQFHLVVPTHLLELLQLLPGFFSAACTYMHRMLSIKRTGQSSLVWIIQVSTDLSKTMQLKCLWTKTSILFWWFKQKRWAKPVFVPSCLLPPVLHLFLQGPKPGSCVRLLHHPELVLPASNNKSEI